MVAATVFHVKTATAPDDPTYNIVVGDWNSAHTVSAMLQAADFANSNNVTFGVSANGVVTASVAAGAAATGISGIAAVGGTATSGTVSFANSNGVSWGMNGQSMTATVKTDYQTSGAYLTTAALSQDSSRYAGTSTGMTGGSVTLNTSGIAINLPAYLTTAALSQDSSKYAGISTGATNASVTLNTSGIAISVAAAAAQTSLSFVNSNGVTFGTAGSTLTATVATNYQSQGAYLTTAALSGDTSKYIQAWELDGNNTAGTTSSAQGTKLFLSAGNSLTLSGNSNTIIISVGAYLTTAQSPGAYLTTAALSGDTTKYVQNWKLTGNSAGTQSTAAGTDLWLAGGQGITLSGSSNSISFSVGSYITTARASTDALGLNTAGTNITWTANSAGLSINNAGLAGTATTMAAGLSATLNSVGLNLSIGAYLTTADLSANSSNYARNWKLTGNSLGTQSSAFGTDLWIAGGNGVTVSGSSNTISIQVGAVAGAYLIGATNSGNTAGTTGFASSQMKLVGTGGLSLSQSLDAGSNSGTITLSVVPMATISSYANALLFINSVPIGIGTGNQAISQAEAFQLPQWGSFSFLRFPILFTQGTHTVGSGASNTSGAGFQYTTFNAVIYSLATGANSQSLTSVASGSLGITYSAQVSLLSAATNWSISQGYSFGAYGTATTSVSTQYSQTAATATMSSGFITNCSSIRWLDIPLAVSLSPGPYWLVIGQTTGSSTSGQGALGGSAGNAVVSYSRHYLMSQIDSQFNAIGDTAGSSGGYLNAGSFSTGGGGTTAAFPMANISSQASNPMIYFQLLRSA